MRPLSRNEFDTPGVNEGPLDLKHKSWPTCLQARLQMFQPPFSHTGVDYFGPFLIRQRRSECKRYGCIFTCLTIRAVHLKVAPDLTTTSFINTLRHAWATYGLQAKSDPPRLLIRPANKFSRAVGLCNISIFIYIMCCSRLPNLAQKIQTCTVR